MTGKNLDLRRVVSIDRVYWDVPVRVPLRPYLHFCKQIDGGLIRLLNRWAGGPARSARRPPRKPR
jgi:hypothetical protein